MRAEDTLQYMADFYPDLFPTRKHALDHLFCVVGSGYEWKNGELVEEDDEYVSRYSLRKPIKKAVFKNEDMWNKKVELYRLASDKNKYQFTWYPISSYSAIMNIPKNIKPDWKALVEECKLLLKADGIEIPTT